jgi:hypothetical protein
MSAVPAAVPSAWLLLVLSGSDFDIQYRMSEIIMMGTGVSGTVPRLNCIMKNPMDCNTCIRAQRALHPELADKVCVECSPTLAFHSHSFASFSGPSMPIHTRFMTTITRMFEAMFRWL